MVGFALFMEFLTIRNRENHFSILKTTHTVVLQCYIIILLDY